MTGEELAIAREAFGLTQARLAELLGKHVLTISAWECGRRKVPKWVDATIRGWGVLQRPSSLFDHYIRRD